MAQTSGGGKVEEIATTFGVDWPHLTAQIISFAIVCALLYWFAYQPVLRMLEVRRGQIAQGLANTEKINAALAGIEAQRQGIVAEARAQATKFLAEAREVAKRLQEQEAQRTMVTTEQIMAKAREAAAPSTRACWPSFARSRAPGRADHGCRDRQGPDAGDQRRLADETTRHLTSV